MVRMKASSVTFLSVRAYILPTIWADIFLVSVDLRSRALWRTGIIRAKDGASIKCTNDVRERTFRHLAVWVDGSLSASSKTEEIAGGRKCTCQQTYKNFVVFVLLPSKLPCPKFKTWTINGLWTNLNTKYRDLSARAYQYFSADASFIHTNYAMLSHGKSCNILRVTCVFCLHTSL